MAAMLKAQVAGIRERNAALKGQLSRQRQVTERLLQQADELEGADQALSREVRRVTERSMEPIQAEPAEPFGVPQLTIGGFGGATYSARFTNSGELTHGVHQGDTDFFFIAPLTDRMSFLAEYQTDFLDSPPELFFRARLERAQIRYHLSDALNVTAGLIRTPLGYWSRTYQFGGWLQPTVLHPDVYEPELPRASRGGILPIHNTGLTVSGVAPFELADLEYSLGLYNGRGKTRTFTLGSGAGDQNDFKAINVLLGVQPRAVPGLSFGGDVYLDKIPSFREVAANTSNPAAIRNRRREAIDETILGGYVTYIRDGWELLFELFHINHDDLDSEQTYKTLGGYLQGAYEFGKFTPYYRLDLIDLGNGDPYYSLISSVGGITTLDPILDHHKHTLGLRWDILPWNALKFEYSYQGNPKAQDEHALTANTAFVF